jgi:hypothetical protein
MLKSLKELELLDLELVNANADYSGKQTIFIDFDGAGDFLVPDFHSDNLWTFNYEMSESEQRRANNHYDAMTSTEVSDYRQKNDPKTEIVYKSGSPIQDTYSDKNVSLAAKSENYTVLVNNPENSNNSDTYYYAGSESYPAGSETAASGEYIISFHTWSQTNGVYLSNGTRSSTIDYNEYTPYDSRNNSNMAVGCVALAASQLIYYWGNLEYANGYAISVDSITFSSDDYYTTETLDLYIGQSYVSEISSALSDIEYDFDPEEIAALSFGVGIKLQSDYGSSIGETGAYTTDVADFLISLGFTAECEYDYYDGLLNDTDFNLTIELIENMTDDQPVIVGLRDTDEGFGHAVIIDGYNAGTGEFHFNMGWAGSYDGWYSLYDLPYEFDIITCLVYDISLTLQSVTDPNLEVSDNSHDFGVDETNWSFTVGNVGFGTLNYSIAGDADWLQIGSYDSSATGADEDTVIISVDRDKLSYGANTATIIVNNTDDDGDQEIITISAFRTNGGSGTIKLIASDGAANDWFGCSVAISGDNIVVGARGYDAYNSGSAYVYSWNGSGYDEYMLTASDMSAYDLFGNSVAIDGDNIVVGANDAVYVYRPGRDSYDEYKLTASDGEGGDNFGCSVATDGDNIVVGANYDDDNGLNSGSVYVYRWDEGSYDEVKLTASDGALNDYFGYSTAIDGDNVVVGAYYDGEGNFSGSAYVYHWNGASYDEIKLTASDSAYGDNFGFSVAIDGDNIVIGANKDDNKGSVYVYHWNGGSYDEMKLTASDGEDGDNFGRSVAISGDNIVVGANEGVFIYHWTGSYYKESKLLVSTDEDANSFGFDVSIAGDTVIVGAQYDDSGSDSGGAHVFYLNEIFDFTAPSTPSELIGAATDSGATLDWADSLDNEGGSGLKGYVVEYADNSDFTNAVSQTIVSSELDISGLDDMTTYYWRVKALDNEDNESAWITTDSFTTDLPDILAPSVPSGLTDSVNGDSVALDWDDSIDDKSGFKEYIVEYADNSDFTGASSQTVAASELDINGLDDMTTYYWRVKAVDNAGNESAWSTTDSFTIDLADIQAPSVPSGLTDSVSGDSVALDWDDSIDDKSGFKEYVVEYADNSDFTGASSQTVAASELDINGLDDMTTYYWRVKAVDNAGNESAWSTTDSFAIDLPDTQAPSVPSGLTDSVNGNSVALDWNDSVDNKSGFKEYVVEYADNSGFTNAVSQTIVSSELDINGLEDMTNYYWRVKAVDNEGNESVWSTVDVFRINLPDFQAPSVPSGLTDSANGNSVALDWDASIDKSKVKYIVEYADNSGFTGASLQTVAASELDINGLEDMTTYYWRVKAVDSSGNESAWSTVESFCFSFSRKNDFDGNSQSDVIRYLSDSGHVKLYLNNSDSVEQKIIGGVDAASWDYVGTGDFNSDGATDVLWRNKDTGLVGAWLLDKGTGDYSSWSSVAGAAIGEWEISGVGDFNGDGTDDVLWYNTQSGLMGAWLVDNGVYSAWSGIAGADPSSWSFSGTGDFNGDGTDDILWCNNDSGLTGAWLLDNGTYSAWTSMAGADLANWSLSGIGDFNGDGTDDVLWCNKDTGLTGAWLLDNGAYSAWTDMAEADLANWQLEGVGDYNGDGTDDVLWCNNDSGLLGYWQIENGQYTNWTTIA